MSMKLKEVLADLFVMGLSVALLWHFSNIWIYGQHLIREPNRLILTIETVGLIIIFVFGLSKFLTDLWRTHR